VDTDWIVGIVVAVVAIWMALLVAFWLLRPKGATVPDLLRLLRSLIGDGRVPADVRIVLVGLLA
jgi:hypothetical protein